MVRLEIEYSLETENRRGVVSTMQESHSTQERFEHIGVRKRTSLTLRFRRFVRTPQGRKCSGAAIVPQARCDGISIQQGQRRLGVAYPQRQVGIEQHELLACGLKRSIARGERACRCECLPRALNRIGLL